MKYLNFKNIDRITRGQHPNLKKELDNCIVYSKYDLNEIAVAAKNGCKWSREIVIKSCMRAIYRIAVYYYSDSKVIDAEDLFQSGCEYVSKAIDAFKPNGNSFFHYAILCARGGMLSLMRSHMDLMRIPDNGIVRSAAKKIREYLISNDEGIKTIDDFMLLVQSGNQPIELPYFDGASDENESQDGVSKHKIELLKDVYNACYNQRYNVRLDSCIKLNRKDVYDDEDTFDDYWVRVNEVFVDRQSTGDHTANRISLLTEINRSMSTLTDREQQVIILYFGIGGDAMTLEEIGDALDLTGERVRQVKEKAIRRLRHHSRSKLLRSYLCDEFVKYDEDFMDEELYFL